MEPCEMCGGDPELGDGDEGCCICPECPECGDWGNPDCYEQGHLEINMAQYMQLKTFEQMWEADARAEAEAMYQDYKEADSILNEEVKNGKTRKF
jgi:hypothetical protein